MKILALTAFYPPHHAGGYGLRCEEVLDGLRHNGHNICLITDQLPADQVSDLGDAPWVHRVLGLKSECESVFSRIRFDKKELKKIEWVIKTFKPDLLYLWHLQNLSDAILPYLASQNFPIVYDEGGSGLIYFARLQKRGLYFYKNEQDGAVKRWLKHAIKAYARVVSKGKIVPDWVWPTQMHVYFNSMSALDHAHAMGVLVDGAMVVPTAVDTAKFPFNERFQLNQPLKIVIPARIKPQKGCIDGVRLVDELRRRHIQSNLLILGDVQDQIYFDVIKNKISKLGLEHSVKINSMLNQEALSEVYRNFAICFFSSYFKTGFSRVPLEAMSSGCLVVTYGNEASSGVVNHGETGGLFVEGDIEGIAEWLQKYMDDPASYKEMINNARRKVEIEHGMDRYLREIESLLVSCVNEYGENEN